jgi:hypothetical protein
MMIMVSNPMETMKIPHAYLKLEEKAQPVKGGTTLTAVAVEYKYENKPMYVPIVRMNAHMHTAKTRPERFHSA